MKKSKELNDLKKYIKRTEHKQVVVDIKNELQK
jgi:hypothetical protein